MPVTTDYQVFAERYHFPSEMEAREQKDEMIAKLQASEANLQAELDLSRSFNERFRDGHELCEVYKGRCAGADARIAGLAVENEWAEKKTQKLEHDCVKLQEDMRCQDIVIDILKKEKEGNQKTISQLHAKMDELKELRDCYGHANVQLSIQLDSACEAFENEQHIPSSAWSEDFDMFFQDLINQRTE